ncbi:molybdenum cofactor biosynthesis protein MoaE [Chryseobacterium piperi]|uniref:Molybdopterin synthase catalytic subunit n=1 Tax=Chryseobacterium piperi TaxID=558152 RepID=A0A086AGQ3_9FLAO|nr:molybdenum cofactor biosynthesis protein MoaE [Chryseobacterium piperi]ASW73934.1 molybdenum cofactor biosynthesis protein MoaE [Chryseobacterium piperi]KFF15867.1 molybdenum cofactor biosynthesis protein MoaE [Chryseobacterium piperi]
MIDIKITDEPLDVAECLTTASDLECGGIATFIGVVRNATRNKKVIRLEYECYESMAVKEIRKIAEKAISLFDVKHVVIHHRVGILFPGDIAVIIIVNARHRDAAFDACRFSIDTLKETVPIWKKEIFEDGEEWVSAHP